MAVTPPPQVEPVKRPHFVQPHECVDIEHGAVEHLVSLRIRLMHGANYNDPGYWSPANFETRRAQR